MKLLLITGGSRGLGEQLCIQGERSGWNLCEFSRSGSSSYSHAIDFADPKCGITGATEVLNRFSSQPWEEIRVILNAGTINPLGTLTSLEPESILAGINANITGPVLFVQTVLRLFEKHSCRKLLVQISSGAAIHGRAGWSIYNLAKAGMDNFMRAIGEEQAQQSHPFETAIVDPGVMDTAMQEEIRLGDFPSRERFVSLKNSGALRAPSTVAKAIWHRCDTPFALAERITVENLLLG